MANMGLKKNARHAAFNRLAMYNYTDLKRFDEAIKAADAFFTESDKADYSYLDYMYYGHLRQRRTYTKISLLLMNRRMIIKKQSVLTRNIIHPLIRNTRLRIYNSSLADFIMVQVRRLIR